MVKNKNKNKKNEKYVGLGTSFKNCFVLYKDILLVVAFLYDDDNKVSHPLVGSLVRSGCFFNDIHNRGQILYESYFLQLILKLLVKFSSLRNVPVLSYALPRRRRRPGPCSETGYEDGQYTRVLNNHAVQRHETKTKLLIFDF